MKRICFVLFVFLVTIFTFSNVVYASSQQDVEITTPDRSMQVKFLKAYYSGDNIVVEMLFRNVGSKDYALKMPLFNDAKAYDEMGNQYKGNLWGTFLKGGQISSYPKTELPSGIPVRFYLYIMNVEKGISFLPMIDFGTVYTELPMNFSSDKLVIKNIPISDEM